MVRSSNFAIYNITFLTSDSKLNILWDFKVCFKESWPFSSKLHHWGHARQLSTYTSLSNNWPSTTLMSYKKVNINTAVQYAFSIKYVQIKVYYKSFTFALFKSMLACIVPWNACKHRIEYVPKSEVKET